MQFSPPITSMSLDHTAATSVGRLYDLGPRGYRDPQIRITPLGGGQVLTEAARRQAQGFPWFDESVSGVDWAMGDWPDWYRDNVIPDASHFPPWGDNRDLEIGGGSFGGGLFVFPPGSRVPIPPWGWDRGGGGGGRGWPRKHDLLDGHVHLDTVEALPLRGDLIVADATSEWDVVGLGVDGQEWRVSGNDPGWFDPLNVIGEINDGATTVAPCDKIAFIDGDEIDITVAQVGAAANNDGSVTIGLKAATNGDMYYYNSGWQKLDATGKVAGDVMTLTAGKLPQWESPVECT